jgi:curved DNA-binding protein
MRLKGKGLPGKPAGDLFVEIQIHTPPAQDEESREFYREMEQKFDFKPRNF